MKAMSNNKSAPRAVCQIAEVARVQYTTPRCCWPCGAACSVRQTEVASSKDVD